jgi:outer membrane scaffolding protein for murein synthesis (MipA/OmpV family)
MMSMRCSEEAAMRRWIVVSLIVALSPVPAAHAQSRGQVIWTISGAGAGFGVGLWAGLSAFDDAVNSDRKVWTSAIVGAGVGAVAGYLIGGRARRAQTHPSIGANAMQRGRQEAANHRMLEQLAKVRPIPQRHATVSNYSRK